MKDSREAEAEALAEDELLEETDDEDEEEVEEEEDELLLSSSRDVTVAKSIPSAV
jgi:hypothetical protein